MWQTVQNSFYLNTLQKRASDKSNLSWCNQVIELIRNDIALSSHANNLSINDIGCQYLQLYKALQDSSLPIEYFVKHHIPGSVPLPYTSFPGKLTEKDVDSYLKKSLAHVPKLQQAVKSRKLNLKDVPLIIYCYKSTCDASHKLEKILRNMGYTNMKHYKGGVLDYFKK